MAGCGWVLKILTLPKGVLCLRFASLMQGLSGEFSGGVGRLGRWPMPSPFAQNTAQAPAYAPNLAQNGDSLQTLIEKARFLEIFL